MSEDNGRHHPEAGISQAGVIDDLFVPVEDPDLSQEQVARILAERAYELAQIPEDVAASAILQLLLFQLNGGHYAVEVTKVREIFSIQTITNVPRTPEFVVGIFSARGRLISIIDLGILLDLSATAMAPETKIIVVANDEIEVGFLADMVEDVMTIFADSLEPPLPNQTSAQSHYTRGISGGVTAVLDLDAILEDPRLIINEEL